MKIKSETLIEYKKGADLNISDSIVFSSNETKDNSSTISKDIRTINDAMHKEPIIIPGQTFHYNYHHNYYHCNVRTK